MAQATHGSIPSISATTSHFYAALQDIRRKYSGDASRIWAGNPRSATVVRRFPEFAGAGVKIATMAANILERFQGADGRLFIHRYFPGSRGNAISRSMVSCARDGTTDELIYLARELSPEFPGLRDVAAWIGGAASVVKQARTSEGDHTGNLRPSVTRRDPRL